jgi:hypothetical protein
MSADLANPFAEIEDLPKFKPAPNTRMAGKEQIAQTAAASGFPGHPPGRTPEPPRRPRGRRYKTGRNQQINIKATPEVIERLYKLADERHIPLGELLEQALGALEASK